MSVHVIVQYTLPQYDADEDAQMMWYPRDCYFEGDVCSVDWDGFVLKLGRRRKIYTNEYFHMNWLLGDAAEEEARARGIRAYCDFVNRDARERELTDIQYLKIGDAVLRDIREEQED